MSGPSFVRYQFRRGTKQDWERINPKLAPGEIGLEYPTINGTVPNKAVPKIKVGGYNVNDASWNDLSYLTLGGSGDASTASPGNGSILLKSDTSGTNFSDVVSVRHAAGTDLSGHISIRGAVIPRIPNTFSLGLTGTRWRNIFVDTSGALNLGYTSLTDLSGQLEISGAIIPGSISNTIGTVTKPWSSVHIGASALTASGDNMIISTKDFFGYNSDFTQTIVNTNDIDSISTTYDGAKICYLLMPSSGPQSIILTDSSGNNPSTVSTSNSIDTTKTNFIKDAKITPDGSNIFIVTFSAPKGTPFLNPGIFRYSLASNTMNYFSITDFYDRCMPNKDGNVLILYRKDTNFANNPILVIYNMLTKTNFQYDNAPTMGYQFTYASLGISDNGERIVITYMLTDQSLKLKDDTTRTTPEYYGQIYNYLIYKSSPTNYTTHNLGTTYRTINISNDGNTLIAGGGNNDISTYSSGIQDFNSTTIKLAPLTITGSTVSVGTWNTINNTDKKWTSLYINDDNIISGIDSTGYLYSLNRANNSGLQQLILGTQGIQDTTNTISFTNNTISMTIAAMNVSKTKLYIYSNKKQQTTSNIGIGTIVQPQARLDISVPNPGAESAALMLRNSGASSGQSVSVAFSASSTAPTSKIRVDTRGAMYFDTSAGLFTSGLSITTPITIKTNTRTSNYGEIWTSIVGIPVDINVNLISSAISSGGDIIVASSNNSAFIYYNNSIIRFNSQPLTGSYDNILSVDIKFGIQLGKDIVYILTSKKLFFYIPSDPATDIRTLVDVPNIGTNNYFIKHTIDMFGTVSMFSTYNTPSQLLLISYTGPNPVRYINMPDDDNRSSINSSLITSFAISSDMNYTIVICISNAVYISRDARITDRPSWIKQTFREPISGYSWSNVSMSGTGSYILLAYSSASHSYLYLSSNNGLTFRLCATIAANIKYTTMNIDGQFMAVASSDSTIYTSSTYGVSWKYVPTKVFDKLTGISAASNSKILSISETSGAKLSTLASIETTRSASSTIGIGITPDIPLDIKQFDVGHPSGIRLQSDVDGYAGDSTSGPSLEFNTRWLGNGATYFQASIQGIDTKAGDSGHGGLRFMGNKNGSPSELLSLTTNIGTRLNTHTLYAYDNDLLPDKNITGEKYPFTLRFGNEWAPSIRSVYPNGTMAESTGLQFLTSNGTIPNKVRMVIHGQTESGRIDMYTPVNIQCDMGASSGGLVVQHTNGTQGIGIGYNTIYAIGSDQNINIIPKGSGIVKIDGISNISNRLSVGPDHNKTYYSYSGNITASTGSKGTPTFAGISSARLVVDSHTIDTELRYGRYFEYPTLIYTSPGTYKATYGGKGDNSADTYVFGYDTINVAGEIGISINRKISIFGDSYIVSSRGFAAFSDERIKTNIKPIVDNTALSMIRNIEPVEYSYIDRIENPHRGPVYGFIAQQVQKHFPDAVNTTDRYIPNIYNFKEYTIDSSSNTLTIYDISDTIVDSTKPGDFIKCFDSSDNQFLFVIKDIVKPGTFICDITGIEKLPVIHDKLKTKIFCYGTHVSDFLTLEKDYLFTLNFAATQELDRTIQKQAAEIADLKAKNAELERKLAAVIAHLGINLN